MAITQVLKSFLLKTLSCFFILTSIFLLFCPLFGNYKTISDYQNNFAIVFLGLAQASCYVNSFFTGRHFDYLFKDKLITSKLSNQIFNPVCSGSFIMQFRFTRTYLYTHYIMIRKTKKDRFHQQMFDGFNFKAKASKVEVILSSVTYFFCFMFLISVLSILIFQLAKLI